MLPSKIYFINGSSDGKVYLFLAGDVEYFGSEHLPYAILALCTLITLIVFPALLMFLYPCACFQRLLNRFCCNSLALRTFMDIYQGIYKDRTNNTRDYCYFSGVFFKARTAVIVSLAALNSYYFTVILGLLFTALAMSMALLHPQKSQLSYTMDIPFTSALAFINPRRACAARVTVVVLCVCVFVCPRLFSHYMLLGGLCYQQLQCYKGKINNVAIFLKPLRSGDMA